VAARPISRRPPAIIQKRVAHMRDRPGQDAQLSFSQPPSSRPSGASGASGAQCIHGGGLEEAWSCALVPSDRPSLPLPPTRLALLLSIADLITLERQRRRHTSLSLPSISISIFISVHLTYCHSSCFALLLLPPTSHIYLLHSDPGRRSLSAPRHPCSLMSLASCPCRTIQSPNSNNVKKSGGRTSHTA